MNLSFRLITPQANRSYSFRRELLGFTTLWHYHPELELVYFMKGKVNALVGDTFRDFAEGDLVLLGSNFPHIFKEQPEYQAANPTVNPYGLMLQFQENFLGKEFLEKPETIRLRHLFERARRGLLFKASVVESLQPVLETLHTQGETRQLLMLLDILFTMAETQDYDYLTNQDYFFHINDDDEHRLARVRQYVYENFKSKITVAKVASIANMSETAFCRYFKSRTSKNFTRFLNEVRVAYACKVLHKPDTTVSDACFRSGFNSLSYFNRQFKAIMQVSPQRYLR